MTVKLALLQSGESIIADIEETSENYFFDRPKRVSHTVPMFTPDEEVNQNSVEVTLSPWILLSKESKISVPKTWVVTMVEPIDSLIEMYERDLNGSSN